MCDDLRTCPNFEEIKPNLWKNLDALKEGGERAKFKFVARPEVDITVEAETSTPEAEDIRAQLSAMDADADSGKHPMRNLQLEEIKKVKAGKTIQSADEKTGVKTTMQTGFTVPVKRGEQEQAVKELQKFSYDADGVRRRLAAGDGEQTYATGGKEQVPGDEETTQGKWWESLPEWAVALIAIAVVGAIAIGWVGAVRSKKRKDARKNTVVEPVVSAPPAPRYSVAELQTMIYQHPDMAIPAVRRQSMKMMLDLQFGPSAGPQQPSGAGKVQAPALPSATARPSVAGW